MSTRQMTGVVDRISEKKWQDVFLYSFTLEGERGWYRTGTTPPPVNKGDYVRFDVDTRKGDVALESIEVLKDEAPTRAPRTGGSYQRNSGKFPQKSSAGAGSRDDYWKEKDRYYKETEVPRITFSACQSRAIDVVKMALENEAINLGATKNKRLENLLAVIDEVTVRFVEQINNLDGNLPAAPDGQPFDDKIPFGDEDNNDGWDD